MISPRYAADTTSDRRTRIEAMAHIHFNETCPFKPTIDEKSKSLARGKRRTDDVPFHTQLFRDAAEKNIKDESLRESVHASFSYKPDIGVNASYVFEKNNVIDRLNKVPEWKNDPHLDTDPETGQAWFTPRVGRGPLFDRNAGSLPIGDFLFASRNEFKNSREQMQQEVQVELQKQASRGFMSSASNKHLAARKVKSFNEIFNVQY